MWGRRWGECPATASAPAADVDTPAPCSCPCWCACPCCCSCPCSSSCLCCHCCCVPDDPRSRCRFPPLFQVEAGGCCCPAVAADAASASASGATSCAASHLHDCSASLLPATLELLPRSRQHSRGRAFQRCGARPSLTRWPHAAGRPCRGRRLSADASSRTSPPQFPLPLLPTQPPSCRTVAAMPAVAAVAAMAAVKRRWQWWR